VLDRQCDFHGTAAGQQWERIQVKVRGTDRATGALDIIAMSCAAAEQRAIQRPEMKRHVASGTAIPISVESTFSLAEDEWNTRHAHG
jgi:hypothetical protein